MAGFTNAGEDKVLDALFGSTVWSGPGTWYLALTTSAPAETDVDITAKEPTYTNYARVALGNHTSRWSSSSAGTKSNALAHYFGTCTAGDGTVVGWALCDALTTGTAYVIGTLTTNKIISIGDVPQIAAADLKIMLD